MVFSAGIRPRDALARAAGLELAERGGVLVDEQCRTSDPHVWAIGECAAPAGRMYGLVAPGYAMAEVVVDAILGGPGTFQGADLSTKLKLLGVDVASFGDAFATTEGALELVFADAVAGVYKKLVVSDGRHAAARRRPGRRRLGVRRAPADGGLGDRAAGQPGGADPPAGAAAASRSGCPTRRQVCSCNDVTKEEIKDAVAEGGSCDSPRASRVHAGRHHLRLVQAGGEVDRRGVLRVRRAGPSTAASASTSR